MSIFIFIFPDIPNDGPSQPAPSSAVGYAKGPNASKSTPSHLVNNYGAKSKGGGKKGLKSEGSEGNNTVGEEEMRDRLSPLEKKHLAKKNRDLDGGFFGRDYEAPGGYRGMKEP